MLAADEFASWLRLLETPGLGRGAARRLLAAFGSPDAVLGAPAGSLGALVAPAVAKALSTPPPDFDERLARALDWFARVPDHRAVTLGDPDYPPQLLQTADPPLLLYVQGRVDLLSADSLAIVGSRNPSAQGRETAFAFAKFLARQGLAITSGLATGIDTEAHRGAIAAEGTTIAVLGSGVDLIYPAENTALSRQIMRRGALISEFPLGTPVRRGNFPQRNRIIAAMSSGTLVVEAARRSGSLITARLAGENGREVFAIPGSIHNPLARGCHQLIRQGAKLTETAEDILGELDFSGFLKHIVRPEEAGSPVTAAAAGMDNDHKILLDALGFDPADIDTLVVRTGFKADAVSSMMLILELEGYVQAAPGGRYSRVARSLLG